MEIRAGVKEENEAKSLLNEEDQDVKTKGLNQNAILDVEVKAQMFQPLPGKLGKEVLTANAVIGMLMNGLF